MPAIVALVHDDAEFAGNAALALRDAGYEVVVYDDPMAALDALKGLDQIDVLVTRVGFPAGRPNGVSLALVMQNEHPGVKVVFAAQASREPHTSGIGELVPHPVDISELISAVRRAAVSRGNSD